MSILNNKVYEYIFNQRTKPTMISKAPPKLCEYISMFDSCYVLFSCCGTLFPLYYEVLFTYKVRFVFSLIDCEVHLMLKDAKIVEIII